jgi:apolipoprotein N-acyltransferase
MEAGRRYNSALLYLPEGRQWELRYDKMHLVPFGEFVPFRRTIPPLYRLLMRLTPYDYEYSLTAGTRSTRFPLRAMEREFRFGVLICYEDTAPEVARRLVYDPDGAKRLDWLVNISNDGWFVRQTSGGIVPTAELAQHMAICVFRAVENRVSVLRSVNTGISVLIDPLGRIRDDMLAGSLPSAAFERQGVAGWFAARITCDSRATVFGTCGRWLDFCCAIGFVGSIIGPSVAGFARSRQRTAH